MESRARKPSVNVWTLTLAPLAGVSLLLLLLCRWCDHSFCQRCSAHTICGVKRCNPAPSTACKHLPVKTHLLVERLPRPLSGYSVFRVFSPLFPPPSFLGSGSSSLKTKRHHRDFYLREGGINKRLYRKDGAHGIPPLLQVFSSGPNDQGLN